MQVTTLEDHLFRNYLQGSAFVYGGQKKASMSICSEGFQYVGLLSYCPLPQERLSKMGPWDFSCVSLIPRNPFIAGLTAQNGTITNCIQKQAWHPNIQSATSSVRSKMQSVYRFRWKKVDAITLVAVFFHLCISQSLTRTNERQPNGSLVPYKREPKNHKTMHVCTEFACWF